MKMFCLPAAGCSGNQYQPWQKRTAKLNVVPIEYPGHGRRVREPLTSSPERLAIDVANQIKTANTDENEFILFGHSVGAALIWRVLPILGEQYCRDKLKFVVISSRPEPSSIKDIARKGQLGRDELINSLKSYNGMPKELFDNKELLDFFLKIFANDLQLNDSLLADHLPITDIPILTTYGSDESDQIETQWMEDWSKLTRHWLGCYEIEGDHFYFNRPNSLAKLLAIIESKIPSYSLEKSHV